METEYASKGVAGSGLGLGIAGTALGIMNGGLGLFNNGKLGGNAVTQEQMKDQQTISGLQSSLALSEAKYANEVGENAKNVEVYKTLASRDRELEGRITKTEERIEADRATFAEYRGSQAEIQRLRDENMRLYIDNKVCPVNAKADMALAYINKVSAVGVASTSVFTPSATPAVA